MILSKKNILITGATGFVGSRLTEKLVLLDNQVHIIVRKESSLFQLRHIERSITIHIYDGTIECLINIIKDSSPDIVYHLASLFLSSHRSADVGCLVNSNILFGTQLLESMSLLNIDKLINTGTSWQNFNGDIYDPVNLYAATKQAFEDILSYYTTAHEQFKAITLKLFDTYGPGDTRGKIVSLLKDARFSKDVIHLSQGEQSLDLVYIDDVLEAFVLAGKMLFSEENIRPFSRYSVASGSPIKLKDLVLLIEDISNQKINVNLGGRPYRDREVMDVKIIDNILPGWRSKVDIKTGLSKVILG